VRVGVVAEGRRGGAAGVPGRRGPDAGRSGPGWGSGSRADARGGTRGWSFGSRPRGRCARRRARRRSAHDEDVSPDGALGVATRVEVGHVAGDPSPQWIGSDAVTDAGSNEEVVDHGCPPLGLGTVQEDHGLCEPLQRASGETSGKRPVVATLGPTFRTSQSHYLRISHPPIDEPRAKRPPFRSEAGPDRPPAWNRRHPARHCSPRPTPRQCPGPAPTRSHSDLRPRPSA
jgi:hypothetical protein